MEKNKTIKLSPLSVLSLRVMNRYWDNDFREYEFTANNLDEFVGFQIKIVSSGTNEAYPPRFKDLRAIALA